ncbi:hypothetical protein CEXT_781691 [Caerostris extrusa]|uniref:Uncharacterized protein n=1 Tax=Caerostris extrusa TaxID=172846 RepID=A0AAV4XJM2_CAEEX|nr:hypothetical protein CEXT_781691 [Caerostris extrusa]
MPIDCCPNPKASCPPIAIATLECHLNPLSANGDPRTPAPPRRPVFLKVGALSRCPTPPHKFLSVLHMKCLSLSQGQKYHVLTRKHLSVKRITKVDVEEKHEVATVIGTLLGCSCPVCSGAGNSTKPPRKTLRMVKAPLWEEGLPQEGCPK